MSDQNLLDPTLSEDRWNITTEQCGAERCWKHTLRHGNRPIETRTGNHNKSLLEDIRDHLNATGQKPPSVKPKKESNPSNQLSFL